jgi:hypothetical protein
MAASCDSDRVRGCGPIDWKQVKTLESDQELLVKQDAYNGERPSR